MARLLHLSLIAVAIGVAIVPGIGIGPIVIGMSIPEATAIMEQMGPVIISPYGPCHKTGFGFCILDFWVYGDDARATHTDGVVLAINTDDQSYDYRGLRVREATADQLIVLVGPPEYRQKIPGGEILEWDTLGLAVSISPIGIIYVFDVFKPRP